MAGRKKYSDQKKRTIALVIYASHDELASIIKDKSIAYEDRVLFGKKKSLKILRRLYDEMLESVNKKAI